MKQCDVEEVQLHCGFNAAEALVVQSSVRGIIAWPQEGINASCIFTMSMELHSQNCQDNNNARSHWQACFIKYMNRLTKGTIGLKS
jgi:hypothetical protein